MNEQRRVLSNYRDRGSVIASVILQRHDPIIIIFIIIQIIVTIVSSPPQPLAPPTLQIIATNFISAADDPSVSQLVFTIIRDGLL